MDPMTRSTYGFCHGERLDVLSSGPFGRGMLGDAEVNDAPPIMGEHEEHEHNAECNGGHGEEVDGDEIFQMIIEERSPAGWPETSCESGRGPRGPPLAGHPCVGSSKPSST